ncbi:MAG: hypothetical protein US98_C0009G0005 [Parcubacteria group bacterium GW2011_GWC1_38_6]|nr:MAG: hypothetical protein US98_C0009G0005 [Parcubacteria group bacterium GW2011_GWC1_38_6]
MPIRQSGGAETQEKTRIDKIINALGNIDGILFDDANKNDLEELDLIFQLTNPEITEIKHRLEKENPGVAKLIFELRRTIPQQYKFDARLIALGTLYFVAIKLPSKELPKRKLKGL